MWVRSTIFNLNGMNISAATFSKYLLFLFFLFSNFVNRAQVLNINTRDVISDSADYWMGWVDFFFEMDNRSPTPDEDASLLTLESSIDIIYVSDQHAYYLSGELNHYQATGDPVISTGYAHVRMDLKRKSKLSGEWYTQFNFDHSRHLQLRVIAGAGLKYQLVQKEEVDFDVGMGLMYEHEKWENLARDGTHTFNDMLKSSNYIKTNIELTDNINLAYISYYQIGYDDTIEDYRQRVSAQLQLEFEFSKHFSFMVEGSVHYENKPVIPINKTIYGIQNGLRYNF